MKEVGVELVPCVEGEALGLLAPVSIQEFPSPLCLMVHSSLGTFL